MHSGVKASEDQVNPLLNHNMESESYWTKGNWSGGTVTQECTTEDKYMGNSSIKLAKTTASGGCDFEQNGIQLEKGGKYTLSAYAKTIDVLGSSNSGAAIFIGYKDSNNVTQFEKRYLSGTSDWHREEMQFILPANAQSNTVWIGCGLLDTTGTAYFDCVQLESGSIANRYNIIENPDFNNGSAFWTKNGQCDGSDAVIGNSEGHPTTFEASAFKFNGQTDKQKNLLQMVNVNGKAGDSFVLGAWAKGDSAPLYYPRNFGISVGFKRASGDYDWHEIKFNNDSRDWQYLSNKVVANSDYTQVACYLIYYNNVNSVMFDGIQLYKEELGDSYTYDSKGNVVSTADLAKQNSSFAYNGSNDLVKSIDPKGSEFNYVYDDKHNINKATSAENVVYSFEYDPYGNPKTSEVGDSSNGLIKSSATYTSDTPDNKAEGNYLSTMTDSSGNMITNAWDTDKGLLKKVTDAALKETTYEYDINTDNLTEVKKTVGTQEVKNSYSYENDRIKAIVHNGFSYKFGYDSLGNNTTVSVEDQELISNEYEPRTGKLLSSTYGNGQIVSNGYDSLDRIISKNYGNEERFVYQYDGSGNLGYKEDKVDSQDIVKYRYIYDLADRLARIQDSKGYSTSYEYESTNNSIDEIKLWHYYGDSRQYHDVIVLLSNDPTFKTGVDKVYSNDTDNSAGLGTSTNVEYTETSAGLSIPVSSIKARYVRFYSSGSTANNCNHYVEAQVIGSSKNMAAGKSVTSSAAFTNPGYIVDGNTGISNYSDSYPNTELQWVQIDLGAPSNIGNGLSRLVETIPGQSSPISTSYEYDKDNRPVRVTMNNKSYMTNSYDALGRLTEKKITDGSINYNTSYSYLAGASGSTTTKVGSITNNGTAISYTYDCNGNIATITQGVQVISYQYNELNEVIRENNQPLDLTITYTYDAGGNILNKSEYSYTTNTDPGTATKTIVYGYTDSNWKDKLTSYNGKSISYVTDPTNKDIGNPISYDGWDFAWEEGRQLSEMTGNGYNKISFKYDDAGIRTQKSVEKVNQPIVTTKYHLVGDKVTYQENVTNATAVSDKIYFSYDSTDNLVSMNLDGVEYYYIRNAQGDIIGLFDKDGNQIVSYKYDTWGKLISIKDGNGNDITNDTSSVGYKNPYRYRGYRYDAETQLYYLQSRYYNPEWGRFINADGITGKTGELLSHNMYSYCDNNPISREDHGGFVWQYIANAAISGVVGGLSYAAAAKASGTSFNWRDCGIAAGGGFISGAISPFSSKSVIIFASGLIGGVQEYTSQKTSGKKIDWKKVGLATAVGVATGKSGYSKPSYRKTYQILGKGLSRYKRNPQVDFSFKSGLRNLMTGIGGNFTVNLYK